MWTYLVGEQLVGEQSVGGWLLKGKQQMIIGWQKIMAATISIVGWSEEKLLIIEFEELDDEPVAKVLTDEMINQLIK